MGNPIPLTPDQVLLQTIRTLFQTHLVNQSTEVNNDGGEFEEFAVSLDPEDPNVKLQFDRIFQDYFRRNRTDQTSEYRSSTSTLSAVVQNFRRRHSGASDTVPTRRNSSVFNPPPPHPHPELDNFPNFLSQSNLLPPLFQSPLFSTPPPPPPRHPSRPLPFPRPRPRIVDTSDQVTRSWFPDLPFSPLSQEPLRVEFPGDPYQASYRHHHPPSESGPTLRSDHHPRHIRLRRSNAFLHTARNRHPPYPTTDRLTPPDGRPRRDPPASATPHGSTRPYPPDRPSTSLPSPPSLFTANFFPFDRHP